MRRDAVQEGDVGSRPQRLALREAGAELLQRRGAVTAPDDQLGDHRVVVHRDRVATAHAGIDPHLVGRPREAQVLQSAYRGRKYLSGSSA